MDSLIETLVVDAHRIEHIARHNVTLDEVLEVLDGEYVYISGHHDRWRIIGQTRADRFLTVVVGTREQPNTYGLVTARPARRDERRYYHELRGQSGGTEND